MSIQGTITLVTKQVLSAGDINWVFTQLKDTGFTITDHKTADSLTPPGLKVALNATFAHSSPEESVQALNNLLPVFHIAELGWQPQAA